MKAFIERVFDMKKQKQKELLDEIIHSEDTEQTTDAAVETVTKEVKKEDKTPGIRMFPDAK
jgi:uncharacterized protein (UPF0305 family)